MLACLIGAPAAYDRAHGAEVVISINKASQSMSVLIDGAEAYNWVISSGVGGGPHDGTYRPGRMERKWASRKYGMAPMPYSIFFDGNYAIHGTVKIAQLGRRASKGCVRLHPRDAAVLFELVQREKNNTTIVVDKATHVAARVTRSNSEAPAAEVQPAKTEPAKAETTAAGSGRPAVSDPEPIRPEAEAPTKPRKARSTLQRNAAARAALRYRAIYGSVQ